MWYMMPLKDEWKDIYFLQDISQPIKQINKLQKDTTDKEATLI